MSWYDSGDGSGAHWTSRGDEKRARKKARRRARKAVKNSGCLVVLLALVAGFWLGVVTLAAVVVGAS